MNFKRLILPIIIMSATCTAFLLQSTAFSSNSTSALATEEISWLDQGHLGVTFNSSSHTDNCQSYQITFSTQIDTYTTEDMTSYIFIDTSTPTGDSTVVNAGVHSIEFSYYKRDVIIPRKVANGYVSTLAPTFVIEGASKSITEAGWGYIDSIIIPNTITSVQKNAFTNIPNTCTVKCMLTEAEVNAKYTAGWTDATNIIYGYEPTEAEIADLDNKSVYGTTVPKPNGQNFIIGYVGQAAGQEWNLPLTMNFEIKRGSAKIAKSVALPIVSANTHYDSVGDELGSYSLSMNIDIMGLEIGDSIVKDSITFTNIYHYKKIGNEVVPNLDDGQFGSKVTAPTSNIDFNDLLTIYTDNIGAFGGYTTINAKVDKVLDAYKTMKPAIYKKYSVEIETGEYTPRYRLTSFNLASYVVTYKSDAEGVVSKQIPISTPIDYVNFSQDKGNSFGISLKDSDISGDFNASKLISLSLSGVYFSMDLWSNTTDAIVAKTAASTRFGNVNVFGNKTAKDVTLFSIPVITAVVMAVYVVLFVAGSVALFFYMKNKYKNDEFKRVKPKKFVATSVKDLVGFALVTMAIFSIIVRCTIFNSTIVTYNPLDVFVIIFSIAGGIFIGFFIKDIVVRVRNYRSNKEKKRLKLDADKVEDGTN